MNKDLSVKDLESVNYFSNENLVDVINAAIFLKKPLLIEGPAGTGKTFLAKAISSFFNLELIRLQSQSVDEVNNQYHEELLKNQEAENIVENISEDNDTSFSQEALSSSNTEESSNDLKEFGVDTDEPDLFNTENQASTSEDLLGSSDEDQEEDDLEIPAFLRRQKN